MAGEELGAFLHIFGAFENFADHGGQSVLGGIACPIPLAGRNLRCGAGVLGLCGVERAPTLPVRSGILIPMLGCRPERSEAIMLRYRS